MGDIHQPNPVLLLVAASSRYIAALDWARERLDRYKLPDCIHVGSDLPVGGTGKADRRALRALVAART